MKKLRFLTILASIIMFTGVAMADSVIKELPKPKTTDGKTLMETIKERHSYRDFSNKGIDNQTLSDILWVAFGVKENGKRTIPTARAQEDLAVYVLMSDGAWLYDGKANKLQQVAADDLRPLLAKQPYVTDAPLTLVYVGKDKMNAALHAGSSYQNVSLYAASNNMAAVVRGLFDKDEVKKALKLNKDENVIVSITVGWPK